MFKVRAFENRTLSWWYQERNNIDMEPIYQRKGELWSHHDKAFLLTLFSTGMGLLLLGGMANFLVLL